MTAISRYFAKLTSGMAVAVGLLTAVITIIVVADVASRFFRGRAIQNADETSILLLIALIFLGLADAQARGENFSVDVLVGLIPGWARRLCALLAISVSFVACSILAFYSARHAIRSTISGEVTYGVSTFPVWPTRIIIAIGLSMLAIQFLIQLVGLVSGKSDIDKKQADIIATGGQ